MFDKSIELYHEKDGVAIKVNINIGNDFKASIGTNLENCGYIEVSSTSTDENEKCFWDNMNFFLKAPKDLIKKDCKKELIDKGLYYKDFFKDLQNVFDELVDAGYLTRNCKKDY